MVLEEQHPDAASEFHKGKFVIQKSRRGYSAMAEVTVGAQTAFFGNVKATTTVLQDMGNPFQDESSDLLSLDTKNIADPSIAQLVATNHLERIASV